MFILIVNNALRHLLHITISLNYFIMPSLVLSCICYIKTPFILFSLFLFFIFVYRDLARMLFKFSYHSHLYSINVVFDEFVNMTVIKV